MASVTQARDVRASGDAGDGGLRGGLRSGRTCELTVHPEKLAFFATGLIRPVVLNVLSLTRESAESIQLMMLVRMMYHLAPDLRRLARPIELDLGPVRPVAKNGS